MKVPPLSEMIKLYSSIDTTNTLPEKAVGSALIKGYNHIEQTRDSGSIEDQLNLSSALIMVKLQLLARMIEKDMISAETLAKLGVSDIDNQTSSVIAEWLNGGE